MTQFIRSIFAAGIATLVFAMPANPQSAQEQGIINTTQILDTSVLFAIGAREAEQAIRGSFGWPTFQEGFVDKVYFRFDPDGYARFSSSPRLDEDVFEVICAESSTACLAKKPNIEIGLTPAGQIQLKIAGITPQDSFFVSDRKSELPLPPAVLGPLDARLETLLASSSELIIKRQVEVIQTVSLSGFSAVVTYLRWVAQGQNPRVFPRGWPVPAQSELQQVGGLTQPDIWASQNVGPQNAQTTFSQQRTFNTGRQQVVNQAPQNGFGGTPFNPNTYGTNAPISNGTQGGNELQAQIIDLQSRLAQLQSGAGQSAQSEDFGESFAQQAQGRSLPTPSGFGQTVNTFPQDNPYDFGNDGSQTPKDTRQSQLIQDITVLNNRMYAIESALLNMKQEIIVELQERQNFTQPFAQAGTSLPNGNASIPGVPMAGATPAPSDGTNMSNLERLLLERLGKPDPLPGAEITNTVGQNVEPAKQRDLITELLNELNTDQNAPNTPVSPSLVEKPKEPTEGFVSLSDYIDQVFKNEKQNAQ